MRQAILLAEGDFFHDVSSCRYLAMEVHRSSYAAFFQRQQKHDGKLIHAPLSQQRSNGLCEPVPLNALAMTQPIADEKPTYRY
jgi:hypothetical protein